MYMRRSVQLCIETVAVGRQPFILGEISVEVVYLNVT